jgi:hypothetical protein
MKVQLDAVKDTARRIWALYRVFVLSVAAGASLLILLATGHNGLAAAGFVIWLFAIAVFSRVYVNRAARVLTGDLGERHLSAGRMMSRRLLALQCSMHRA